MTRTDLKTKLLQYLPIEIVTELMEDIDRYSLEAIDELLEKIR